MTIACLGQLSAHFPQPVHRSGSGRGVYVKKRLNRPVMSAGMRSLKKLRSGSS